MNRWKSQVNNAIIDTCIAIIKEPLIYFSESDVQQLLCENLRKIKTFSKMYRTSLTRGKNSKSFFKTSMLHREYGGGNGTRIDIVAFHPKQLRKINNPNLKNDGEYLKPMIAFELGTEKTIDALAHYKSDITKLKKVSDSGYLIHIYKDFTQSRKGTKSRNNTEVKIQSKFKDVFEKNNVSNKKIKVLAMLLRTYVNQEKMIGKCEIFDRESKEWKKVNVSKNADIRIAIDKQLTNNF
jgi:hypothetical protein